MDCKSWEDFQINNVELNDYIFIQLFYNMCILKIYLNSLFQFIFVLFFLLFKSGLIFHISKTFWLFSILYFLFLDLQLNNFSTPPVNLVSVNVIKTLQYYNIFQAEGNRENCCFRWMVFRAVLLLVSSFSH